MLISVVTYTYNRADILKTLLESICSQTFQSNLFEFIVVDNNSTDQTRSLVDSYCSQYSNVHYCFEEKLGTSSARNHGWQEAKGEYVAFIDDDGMAHPKWLEIAAGIVQDKKPDVFGGPVLPYYSAQKPKWFKDEYGIFSHGERARQLESDKFIHGNNFFICRELLEAVNGFDEHLGHHGISFGYGEETDLLFRIRTKFPDASIYYDPRLYNYHLIRIEKFSLLWQIRSRFALGRFSYLVFNSGKHALQLRHLIGVILLPMKIVYGMTLGVLFRDKNKFKYPQNYYFEQSLEEIRIFGKLVERLKQVMIAFATQKITHQKKDL